MKKFIAFTLSEVLVTLGIIGVVSAMTVPTLMRNHQRQVFTTQLRKVYSEMSQAFQQVMTDRHAINLTETKMFKNGPETFFKTYLKTTQVCKGSDMSDCLGTGYEDFDGKALSVTNFASNSACAVLTSGAVVCMTPAMYMAVDVNGKQGPNIAGRDYFGLQVYPNGEINGACNVAQSVDYDVSLRTAFGHIVKNGWQMDY